MIGIRPFALERYFAQHEFSAAYILSASDCEPLSMKDLLETADEASRRLWEELKFGYTETLGLPALRKSVAGMYRGIDANHILVAAPEEGIYLSMQALLEPGDHIVCTFPGYQSLYELARALGCKVSLWKSEADRGWHFSLEKLSQLLGRDTKMVIVNFPHNPTGFLPTPDDFKGLVDLVHQQGAYLFSDEMYRFLEVDGAETLPAGCEIYDKALSLGGLSKSFGLPGLRIGWIATRDQAVLKRLSRLRDYTTICNSAPSEVLALMAVKAREGIVGRQKARIQRNLAVLDDFFDGHDEIFSWNRPRGGSVGFPRLSIPEGSDAFCRKLVKETGILLVPSSLFQYGDRHVRFGFGRENLPEVVGRLEEYLASYLKR